MPTAILVAKKEDINQYLNIAQIDIIGTNKKMRQKNLLMRFITNQIKK